ncbi:AAA family ATPase [Nocardia sp. CNY236]|uniref:AAA family ATPase n=1 Tax=Nocardia sp. CNY236 TaxID=1169152 RepID=UPI00041079D4|nr:AAA family ATPase [Nocardia sp. CNY236]
MTDTAPRVIAFEGIPFAGKSTAANELAGQHPGVRVVPDYHEMLTKTERVRVAQLSDSADDQHHRVAVYRDLDDRRWKQANESGSPTVIFDRCYLSIAAYRLALHTAFGLPGDPDTAGQAPAAVCERPIPPVVVFFAVPVSAAVERHNRLARTIDTRLRTREFLSTLIDSYRHVLTACDARVLVVDSNRPLTEVVAYATECVREFL